MNDHRPSPRRYEAALRSVVDPELCIDVVSLGLVYDVRMDDGRLVVDMTLTTPGCPVADALRAEARTAVDAALAGDAPVDVRLVWEPPWTPDRMTCVPAPALARPRRRWRSR